MQIAVHYTRIIGPSAIYQDIVVEENSQHIKLRGLVNLAICAALTRNLQRAGLIHANQQVGGVDKFYSFQRAFNILTFRDPEGGLLGYYSDICTPLRKIGEGKYATTDLMLDLWTFPNGSALELDWDEFDHAIQNELISPELQSLARNTLAELRAEQAQGIYPQAYL